MMPASVKLRVTCATWATLTPFCIRASRRSSATSSPPVTATQPARAMSWQTSGVKKVSKRMLPHQVAVTPRSSRRSESFFSRAGGAASSTRWNPVWPVSRISASMRSTNRSAEATL